MKVLTIMGSPRETGNTATVLGWLEEEIKKLGHEVERVSIIGKKIGGCVECYQCKAPEVGFACAQEDDANAILEKMGASDALVIATPLFCWSFSGQLKPLIDRMFSQAKGHGTPEYASSFEGRPIALVATCAGPIEGNAELLIESFKRMAKFLASNVAGTLVVPLCTPVNPPSEAAKEQARELASAITRSSA